MNSILVFFKKSQNLIELFITRSHCKSSSDKLRLHHYIWLAIISVPLSVFFIVKNILNNHYNVAVSVAILLVFMLTSLFLITKIKRVTFIYHAGNCVFMLMLILVSLWGSKNEGQILWCYTYPLLSIFLFGYQLGSKWSLFLLFAIIASLALNNNPDTLQYSLDFKFRFVIIYLTVLSITLWLEHSRSQYIAHTLQQRKELEKERESLNKEIKRRIKLEHELHKLANQDGLTEIYNRRYFLTYAGQELLRGQRYNTPMAMALIDLDKFKRINDQYGHPAGDQVLKCFARHCKNFFRNTDIYGRIGGEEFAILLVHVSARQALEIMERFRQEVGELQCLFEKHKLKITISIGLAMASNKVNCIESLYSAADKALYDAKHNGRNRLEMAPLFTDKPERLRLIHK